MVRLVVVIFVCVAAISGVAAAQTDTPTAEPTITPTPSITPSPTPNVIAVWTLTPPEGEETGQAVQFIYSVDAADQVVVFLLAAILFSQWGLWLLSYLREARD